MSSPARLAPSAQNPSRTPRSAAVHNPSLRYSAGLRIAVQCGHGTLQAERIASRLYLLRRSILNPPDACSRFLRQLGVSGTRPYRAWTKPEQQRLLDLIASLPVQEAAVIGRPTSSVRSMLHRLGVGARRGREWFTKYTLAEALHIRHEEVQKWIDRGWLKSRSFQTSGLKMGIIDPEDFCKFFKEYGREVVGRRLSYAGLWFVCNYVFPPRHADLLSVRASYNKESMGRSDVETERIQEEEDEVLGQTA